MNNAAALVGRSSLSLIILIVGCALLASTMGKTYADLGGAFSPVFFPRIILVGWIVMAALSVISDALGNKESGSTQWGTVVLVSVSLFVYIQLMPLLGFFIVSVVFCDWAEKAAGYSRFLSGNTGLTGGFV